MERRHEPNINELISLDPEKHGVLMGVLESRGDRDFAKFVLGSLMSGEKSRVVVGGPPGNGKTTLLTQLKSAYSENAARLGVSRPVIVTQYDKYLTGVGDDSYEFNLRILEDIRKKEEEDPDAVHLIENPAVGFTEKNLPQDFELSYDARALGYVKDRGLTVLEGLEEDSRDKKDTIFVVVLSNTVVEQRAGFLRAYIQQVDDGELISELDRLGVTIKGVDMDLLAASDIKAIFGKMANANQMQQIKKEIKRQTSDWAMHNVMKEEFLIQGLNHFPINVDDIMQTLSEFELLSDNSEAQASLFAQIGLEEARREAAFYEDMFVSKGIDRQSRAIVFNPYNNRNTILDFASFRASR